MPSLTIMDTNQLSASQRLLGDLSPDLRSMATPKLPLTSECIRGILPLTNIPGAF